MEGNCLKIAWKFSAHGEILIDWKSLKTTGRLEMISFGEILMYREEKQFDSLGIWVRGLIS